LLVPLVVIGVAVTVYALVSEPAYGWAGILIAAVFGLTIAIGGALLASINIATNAQVWRPIRHSCVGVARTLPVPAVALALVLGLGISALYPWANEEIVESSHLLHGKTGYLNQPFFIARSIVILLIWFAFVGALRKRIEADEPKSLARTAIGFLIVFALTVSVGFWDWTMSLEPEWFSTMHGVYGFAGCLQVGIAVVALAAMRDKRVGAKPLFDLGSLLFAFSLFWGYIWYSQGMLIWYANIPEETVYYATRFSGGWTMLFWLNPLLNLVVPIIVLMSRHAKRSRAVVGQVALVVVIGHFLDILLQVGPSVGPVETVLPVAAAGTTIAVAAGMLLLHRRNTRA
jgi:hypothetical protein